MMANGNPEIVTIAPNQEYRGAFDFVHDLSSANTEWPGTDRLRVQNKKHFYEEVCNVFEVYNSVFWAEV
jgi:hypothetical protein